MPNEVFCLGSRPYVVSPYFPPVKFCNKCKKYGHWTNECKNDFLCKCGEPHREDLACQAPPRCIHCNEAHSSNDPNCSKLKHEREIIAISHEQNISFRDARAKASSGEISYATMAKRSTHSNPPNSNPPNSNPINRTNNLAITTAIVDTKDMQTGSDEVLTKDMQTGRDDVDSTMGQQIDLTSGNLIDDIIIIPTKYKQSETNDSETEIRDPMYWHDEMQRLSEALIWAEDVSEDKKEKFKRALDVLLSGFRDIQESTRDPLF